MADDRLALVVDHHGHDENKLLDAIRELIDPIDWIANHPHFVRAMRLVFPSLSTSFVW